MKIKAKMSIMVIAIMVIVVTGVAVILLRQASSMSLEMSRQRLHNLTTARAEMWKGKLNVYLEAVRSVADVMSEYEAIPVEERRDRFDQMLLAILTKQPEFVRIFSIWKPNALDGMDSQYIGRTGSTATGQYAMTIGRDTGQIIPTPNLNIVETMEYITGPNARKDRVERPMPFRIYGQDGYIIRMGVPIINPRTDEVVGIVTCLFNVGMMQPVLENALKAFEEIDTISIYFNNGFIMACYRPERIGKMLIDEEIQYGEYRAAVNEAVLAGKDFEIYSYAPLLRTNLQSSLVSFQIGNSNTTWTISMGSGAKHIMKDVNVMTRFTIILAVIAIAATAGILYIVLGSITKPIGKVAGVLKHVAEGDLTKSADVNTKDEIGDLSRDLNSTVGKIKNMMTELISAKERAIQANKEKSGFLAKMSHEIRTPMNAILGITEIQLQNEMLSPDMQEALDRIYNSGYLLLGIINNILDLSKIEAGKLELSPVNYDVASLINDVIHLSVMHFDSKAIEFTLQVDENIPSSLFGDDLRIKQILNNLLSNAFKYTDSGKVSLSVTAFTSQAASSAEDEASMITLVFRVSDTGQGMTAEQVSRLFDEYTRFNTEANRATEGTGLGMSITKHLVSLMGGEIAVESELGKGSTFTLRLPQGLTDDRALGREVVENLKQFHLGRAAQMKKAPQIVREYMPYGRILIVDDIETNLYVARGLMTPYALSVETATSGFEAIERIKNGASYDAIFMDHYMPRMDGMEATRILREMGYTHSIIALTANALAGQAEIFLENGFDWFISKPIDIRQLNIALNRFVRDKYPPEVVKAARRQAAILAKPEERPLSKQELAAIFVRDAEKAIAVLEPIHANNYRRNDDVQLYVITVHAMKSALANIGETELSAAALNLEMAGREKSIAEMAAETPVFLDSLRATIKKIIQKNENKDINEEETADIIRDDEREYFREKLLVIEMACTNYDSRTVNDSLDELRQKKWPRTARELLDTIAKHLLHSEFTQIAQCARDYRNS